MYFEQLSVEMVWNVWALHMSKHKVKPKEGKRGKEMEEYELAFSHIRWGKWGLEITTFPAQMLRSPEL
jgi:hypothetical protein